MNSVLVRNILIKAILPFKSRPRANLKLFPALQTFLGFHINQDKARFKYFLKIFKFILSLINLDIVTNY